VKRRFNRSGKFYVYILECQDGAYYTGYTRDLKRRVFEHNNIRARGAKYLRGKTPAKLVYAKEYRYYKNAVHAEMDIKKRTRIEKTEMIKAYKKVMKGTPQIYQPSADKSKRGVDNQRCVL